MAVCCPITVATAAPLTPMAGKPNRPKIIMGSRMMLVMAPSAWSSMGKIIEPVDWNTFSMQMWIKEPAQKVRQMLV